MAKFFGKGKKSFLKGIKKSSKRNLQLEPLEERQLLSVNPIWSAEKSVNSVDGATSLTLEFADALKNDPALQNQPVVFGIRVSAGNTTVSDSSFDPGQINISNKDQDAIEPVIRGIFNNYQGTKDTLILVELKPGDYNITIKGENSTTGAFTCEVFMPGDFSQNEANTFGSSTSLVEQSEFNLFKGATAAANATDPYTTINEFNRVLFQKMYGQSYEWFNSNSSLFDINGNGSVDNNDYEIACINYNYSEAMKNVSTDYNDNSNVVGENGIKLIADNSGSKSSVVIGDASETGVTGGDGTTAYVSSLENLTGIVRDSDGNDSGSKISKIEIVIRGKVGSVFATFTMIISDPANTDACDPIEENTGYEVDFSKLEWGEDKSDIDKMTDITLYLEGTDEYGNSNIAHDEYGNIDLNDDGTPKPADDATLTPINVKVNPDVMPDYKPSFDPGATYSCVGTEKQNSETGLNYTVNLNTMIGTLIKRNTNDSKENIPLYFAGSNSSNLVFASAEVGKEGWIKGSFTKVFTDEDSDTDGIEDTATVKYQYRVFKDGKLELQILDDSAKWLTKGNSNALNNLIIENLNIATTDAYHAGSTALGDWVTSSIKVNINAENDAPTAGDVTAALTNRTENAAGNVIEILKNISDPDRWDTISLSKIGDVAFGDTNILYATVVKNSNGVWELGTVSSSSDEMTNYITLTRIDTSSTPQDKCHNIKIGLGDCFKDLVEKEEATLVINFTAADNQSVEVTSKLTVTITGEYVKPEIISNQQFILSLTSKTSQSAPLTYDSSTSTIGSDSFIDYNMSKYDDNGTVEYDTDWTINSATMKAAGFSDVDVSAIINQNSDSNAINDFCIAPDGRIFLDGTYVINSLLAQLDSNFGNANQATIEISLTLSDDSGKTDNSDTKTIEIIVMRKGLPVVDKTGDLVDSGKSMTEDETGPISIDQNLLYGLWEIEANADETPLSQYRATSGAYDEKNCYEFTSITLNTASSQFVDGNSAPVPLASKTELLNWVKNIYGDDLFEWSDLGYDVSISEDKGVFSIRVESDTFKFLGRDQKINLAFDVVISDKDFTGCDTTRTMYVMIQGMNDKPEFRNEFRIELAETPIKETAYEASVYESDYDFKDELLIGSIDVSKTTEGALDYKLTSGNRTEAELRTALIAKAGGEENLENWLKGCLRLDDGVLYDNHIADGNNKFDFLRSDEKIQINYKCAVGNVAGDFNEGSDQSKLISAQLFITGVSTAPVPTEGVQNLGSKKDVPTGTDPTSLTGDIAFTDVENHTLSLDEVVSVSGVIKEDGKADISEITGWFGLTDDNLKTMLTNGTTGGTITFTDDADAFAKLNANQTLTLTYTYKAKYKEGTTDVVSTDAKTVTVTITGTNQAPTAIDKSTGNVSETATATLKISDLTTGNLTDASDVDFGDIDKLQFSKADFSVESDIDNTDRFENAFTTAATAAGYDNVNAYLLSMLKYYDKDGYEVTDDTSTTPITKVRFVPSDEFKSLRVTESVAINLKYQLSDGTAQSEAKSWQFTIYGETTLPEIVDQGTTIELGSEYDTAEKISGSGIYAKDWEGYTSLSLYDIEINYTNCKLGDTALTESDFTETGRFNAITTNMLKINEDGNLTFEYGDELLNLNQNENLTLSFSYKVKNTNDQISTNTKTVIFEINGTNQAPKLVEHNQSNYLEIKASNGTEILINKSDCSSYVLVNDDDNGDSFTFYKFGGIEITTEFQTYSDSDGALCQFKFGYTHKELIVIADQSFKYGLTEGEEKNFSASLTVKDSSGAESDSPDFNFKIKGEYDPPVITASSLTISDSYGGDESATPEQLSTFQTIGGQVDHSETGSWSITDVTYGTEKTDLTNWGDYFEIVDVGTTGNAKIKFKSSTARTNFLTYCNTTLGIVNVTDKNNPVDFYFTVALTDSKDEFDSKEVKLNVISKMPPKVDITELQTPGSDEDVDSIPGADLTQITVSEADDVEDGSMRTGNWYSFGNFKVDIEKTWESLEDSFAGSLGASAESYKSAIGVLTATWNESSYSIAITDQFDFLPEGESITLYYTIDVIDETYGCATAVEISTVINGVLDVPTAKTVSEQTIEDTDTSLVNDIAFGDLFTMNDETKAETFYNFDILVVTTNISDWGTFDIQSAADANTYFKGLICWNSDDKKFSLTNDENILNVLKQIPAGAQTEFVFSIIAKNGTDSTAVSTAAAIFTLKVNGTNQAPTAIDKIATEVTETEMVSLKISDLTTGNDTNAGDVDYGDIANLQFSKAEFSVTSDISDGARFWVAFSSAATAAGYDSATVGDVNTYFLSMLKYYDKEGVEVTDGPNPITEVRFVPAEVFQSLRKYEVVRITVKYKLSDGTETSDEKTWTLTINGESTAPVPTEGVQNLGSKNDVPTGTDPTSLTGDIAFTDVENHPLSLAEVVTVSGVIKEDGKENITEITGWFTRTVVNPENNEPQEVPLTADDLKDMLTAGTTEGTITFTDNGAFAKLNANQTLTLTYTYKAKYNDGTEDIVSTAAKTVTVTINGTNQAPSGNTGFISKTIEETDVSVSVTVIEYDVTDLDYGDEVTFSSFSVRQKDDADYVVYTPSNRTENDIKLLFEAEVTDLSSLLEIDSTDNKSVVFTSGEHFKFLRAGESITINYELELSDNVGATKNVNYTVVVSGVSTAPEILNKEVTGDLGTASDSSQEIISETYISDTAEDSEGYSLSLYDIKINYNDCKLGDTYLTEDYFTDGGRFNAITTNMLKINEDGNLTFDYGETLLNLKQNENLTLSLSYKVKNVIDQISTDAKTVTLRIDGTNQAPTAIDKSTAGVTEDKNPVSLTISDLTTDNNPNASDVDFGDIENLRFSKDDFILTSSIDNTARFWGDFSSAVKNDESATVGDVNTYLLSMLKYYDKDDNEVTDDTTPITEVRFVPAEVFQSLREGESVTISLKYKLSDGTETSEAKTWTFTINGKNTAPTADSEENYKIPWNQSDSAGKNITADADYFLNNPDFGKVPSAGTGIRTEITEINDTEVTCNFNNRVNQTIEINDPENGKYGDIAITWDAVYGQIVTWKPVENEYIKWNIYSVDKAIEIPIEFKVKNVYTTQAGEPEATSKEITIIIQDYSKFDALEFGNVTPELKVFKNAPRSTEEGYTDYIEVGKLEFKAEKDFTSKYSFIEFGDADAGRFKYKNNGDNTVSVYVKKTYLATSTGTDVITLGYSLSSDGKSDMGNKSFKLIPTDKTAPNVTENPQWGISEEYTSENATYNLAGNLTVTDGDELTRGEGWWALNNLSYDSATGDSASNVTGDLLTWIENNVTLSENGQLSIGAYTGKFDFLKKDETLTLNFKVNVVDNEYSGSSTEIDVPIVITGVNDAPKANDFSRNVDLASSSPCEIQLTDLGSDVDDGISNAKIMIYGYATEGSEVKSWITLDSADDEVWINTTTYAKGGSKCSLKFDDAGKLVFNANDAFYGLKATDGIQPVSFRYILFDEAGDKSAEATDETSGSQATVNVTGNYTSPKVVLAEKYTGTTGADTSKDNEMTFNLKELAGLDSTDGIEFGWKLFSDSGCLTEITTTNTIIKSIEYNETSSVLTVTFFQKYTESNPAPEVGTDAEKAIIDLNTSDVYLQVSVKDTNITGAVPETAVTTLSLQEKDVTSLGIIVTNNPDLKSFYGDKLQYVVDDYEEMYLNTINVTKNNYETITSEANDVLTPYKSGTNYYYDVDIWLQDQCNNYFGTAYDTLGTLYFMIEFNSDYVKNVRMKSCYVSNNALDSIQLKKGYTDEDNINKGYILVPFQTIEHNGYGKGNGFNGTALLLARLNLLLEPSDQASLVSSEDLGLVIKPVDKAIFSNVEGYSYRRAILREKDTGGWGITNNVDAKTDHSQIVPIIREKSAFSNLVGYSSSESIVSNGIYVRTVTEETALDAEGKTDTLSANVDYINEWQTHYAEIWVKASKVSPMLSASVDFGYDSNFFNATEIEFGSAFTNGSYSLDKATGKILQISGDSVSDSISGDGYVLLARVKMEAVVNGGVDIEDCNVPHSLGWTLENGLIMTADGQRSAYLGRSTSTELWGITYDTNDDGCISSSDLSAFANMYGRKFDENNVMTVLMDFDQDGEISSTDLSIFAGMYGISQKGVTEGTSKVKFPEAFNRRFVGSTLETEDDTAWVGVVLDRANSDWQAALDLEAPVQVQLIVKDLGGQTLAEAKVTEYNEDGTPARGVIYLDNDALGNTWYTQMTVPETGTEKYDLYTVLLHELGHLYGYEVHSTNASDVMSPILNPGQRKTITQSEIDALLQNVYSGSETESGSVLQSELPDGSTVVVTEIVEGGSDEIVMTEETNDLLNANGLNVPEAQIMPSPARIANAVISEIYLDDDDDDDDELDLADLATGDSYSHDYEKTLDSVLEDYLG